ncbi:hypothetical protein HC762_00790 [bacterium]|nr:hypothetical protein [bacterium]
MYLRVGTLAAILAAAASAFPLAEVGDGEAPAGLARSMQPGAAVDKRDGRTNCGSRDAYVSVDTFNQKVEAYCSAAAGINIAKGSQHSNSYEVHLTNQEDPDKPGLLGRVICQYCARIPRPFLTDLPPPFFFLSLQS